MQKLPLNITLIFEHFHYILIWRKSCDPYIFDRVQPNWLVDDPERAMAISSRLGTTEFKNFKN